MVFAKLRAGLDLKFWLMSSDRFCGVEGSLEVAGVNSIEFDITQSFCDCFRLETACFCERHVKMALRLIVDVALGFTMTNQVDGARRWVDNKFWRAQVRIIRAS